MRRRFAVAGAALLVVSLSACQASAVPSEYDGVFDSRAVETCKLLFGGLAESEMQGAVDSDLAAVAEIAEASGLDPADDPNLASLPAHEYAALCLVELDERFFRRTHLFYQLEVPAQSGEIARY